MSSSALALIGDTFQARIGFWKCWFLRRGENRSTNNNKQQSTYGSGNQTRDTLVGGERSHHCAIPVPMLERGAFVVIFCNDQAFQYE